MKIKFIIIELIANVLSLVLVELDEIFLALYIDLIVNDENIIINENGIIVEYKI